MHDSDFGTLGGGRTFLGIQLNEIGTRRHPPPFRFEFPINRRTGRLDRSQHPHAV